MPANIVVGLQYGDEGKAKISQYLAKDHCASARFGGGSNCGHTIYVNNKKIVLHMLPAGASIPHHKVFVTPGVLVDPVELDREMNLLNRTYCLDTFIDHRCTIVTSNHKEEDSSSAISESIGTTKRGIGQAVSARALRSAGTANKSEELAGYTSDTQQELLNLLKQGNYVLFEGAQGTLLDIHYGSYPFVTSTCTLASAVCTNAGIPPKYINKVYGVIKPYCTRVGNGPLENEITETSIGRFIQKEGNEVGATTGRPRRIGWLDLDKLKFACDINGVTDLVVTKTDLVPHIGALIITSNGQQYPIRAWSILDLPNEDNSYEPQGNLATFINILQDTTDVEVTLLSYGRNLEDTVFIQ